ncbi:MAG: hypothetical protein MPW14_10540 [Candidatus Manganitrophus sp.]|nr:hypothetical protein [Candidatus Manganitrophus sp.]WDT70623.1 MAG: hypothetical protein MPW17_18010 [Candidatus Manganitrophus sp.]WDT82118.1 MAG: hypothetical protein MPW14_10540 [Candidatus Manganitrophus sp.]
MYDSIFKTEQGIALIAAVFLIVVFGFLGLVVVSLVGTQGFSSMNEVKSSQALFIAEGGMERAILQFRAGVACAALTNVGPTGLGAGSFTILGTLFRPVSTLINQGGGINNNVTTIPVDSTAGYASHGRIRIDNEWIDYRGTTATSFTGARRGAAGSTAAAHADNAPVAQSQCLIRATGQVNNLAGNTQRVVERAIPMGVSVQTGTATVTIDGTVTVNIPSAVNPVRSFLIFNARHNSNRPVGSYVRGRIASATTLEFVRVTNEGAGRPPINVQWYVVEYDSGVSVQRGSVDQEDNSGAAGVQINVPLTPLGAVNRAFVTWSKTPTDTDVDYSFNDPVLGEITAVNNLQFRVDTEADTHTIWWQVIEYTTPGVVNVQDGTTTFPANPAPGVLTRTITPATALNPANSFVLVGFRATDGPSYVGARMLRAQINAGGNIVIDRGTVGTPGPRQSITEAHWQAVSLLDGSMVQGGSENFPNGDAQEVVALGTPVDPDRSIVFASVQPVSGQSMGSSPYSAAGDTDIIGVGSVTMTLTGTPMANQITMDRNNTVSSTDIGWFVVQFASGNRPPIDWVELFQ